MTDTALPNAPDTRDEAELTEDEQWAAATKGNPLFDGNTPEVEDQADDTATSAKAEDDDAESGDDGNQADIKGGAETHADEAESGSGEEGDADTSDEPFPGYAGLAPEAREAFDKLSGERAKFENDYKALHGMTAPLQRSNAELQRQLQAQTARIQQLEQLGRKQHDVSEAQDATIKEYDEWAQQFPEESKAITALVNPLREKVSALEGSLQAARTELGTLHTERQQAALAREIGELEKAHGDWRQIHDSEQYWEWLHQQPPGIQSLNGSMFAGDTIQLLNLYKSTHAPAPAPATDTPTQGNPPPNTADAVQQRRSQALARGTQPAVRSTESAARGSNQAGSMTDEDAQWAALTADNPLFE